MIKRQASIKPMRYSERVNIQKKIIICLLLVLVSYIGYILLSNPVVKITLTNVIIFASSLLVIGWSLFSILEKGILVSNAFGISYFTFLALNNLNISALQKEKVFSDIYYLVIGALLFILIIRAFEMCSVNLWLNKGFINARIVAIVFWGLFIGFKGIVFLQTGIRALDGNFASGVGGLYAVSGFSGLAELFLWLMLMCIPIVKKKYKILFGISALLIHGILQLSRNNLMICSIFIAVCIIQSYGKCILRNKRIMRTFGLIAVVVLGVFIGFGNYRQIQRGWDNPASAIRILLGSSSDNSVINWLYGYTIINYDVILRCMVPVEHPGTWYSIFFPFTKIVGNDIEVAAYLDAISHIDGLRGFNASTLFGPIIYEQGAYYVMGVIVLALIVGSGILIARLEKADGILCYLITWAIMSVFGNYYTITVQFYTLVIACVVFGFVQKGNKDDWKNCK